MTVNDLPGIYVRGWKGLDVARRVVAGLFLLMALGCFWQVREWGAEWREALPTRLEEKPESRPKVEHYMRTGLYWGVLTGGVVMLVMAAAGPLWLRRPGEFLEEKQDDKGGKEKAGESEIQSREKAGPWWPGVEYAQEKVWPLVGNRGFWLLLFGIAVLGTGLRAERMDLSVYNDDEYSLRRHIRGTFERPRPVTDIKSDPVFTPVSWQETFFENREGNNHILFSALSRLCLNTWQAATGRTAIDFSHWAFRMPSFLAGIGMILFTALLLRSAGLPRAALIAALLIAVHPWLIRFSTEGRGYALATFFTLGHAYFAYLVLRYGRWRWWILYGVAQFGALYANLGVLWCVVLINIGAMLAVGVRWVYRVQYPVLVQAGRYVAVNLVTIALLVPLLLPSILQIEKHTDLGRARDEFDETWIYEGWSRLTSGMNYFRLSEPVSTVPTVQTMPLAWTWVMVVAPVLVLAAIIFLVRRRGIFLAIWPMFVLAPVMTKVMFAQRELLLYIWYMLFATPGILILIALGMEAVWRLGEDKRRQRVVRAGLVGAAGAAIILYLMTVSIHLPNILKTSKFPLKPALEAMGRPIDPTGQKTTEVIGLGHWTPIGFYDPHIIVTYDLETLEEAIAWAEETDRPLSYCVSDRRVAFKYQPEILDRVEKSGDFELVARIPGLTREVFVHHVWRYRHTPRDGE